MQAIKDRDHVRRSDLIESKMPMKTKVSSHTTNVLPNGHYRSMPFSPKRLPLFRVMPTKIDRAAIPHSNPRNLRTHIRGCGLLPKDANNTSL